MKATRPTLLLGVIALIVTTGFALAQLAIPSDGSDGALNITSNTLINLGDAVTGAWNTPNTANAGKGIYDPEKWAVVFKYSSVNIAAGAKVTFTNHPSRSPVVWLVSGNVTIDGEVSLDGASYLADPLGLAEPGPGGFRGGAVGQLGLPVGPGCGPGGGPGDSWAGWYSTTPLAGYGEAYGPYGNAEILPLIGGSGSAGTGSYGGGGGGGGALLIAASGILTVNGSCHADGGDGYSQPGSGGAIRLVANQILGSGRVQATSRNNPGRTRLEANSASPSLLLNPPTMVVPPNPLVIWAAADAPSVKVISVQGHAAPADPKASMSGADLSISTTKPVSILLQTANFPTNGAVYVYLRPRNGVMVVHRANCYSGDTVSANWQLVTNVPAGYFIVQARTIAQ